MRDIAARRVTVVDVETPRPSPFASSLLFGYVAQFLYEGDSPLAERRAADYFTKSAGHPPQALVKRAEEEAKEAQKGKSQAPVVVMK